MNTTTTTTTSRSKWKPKKPQSKLLSLSLITTIPLTLILLLFFFTSPHTLSLPLFTTLPSPSLPQCKNLSEKFLFYTPHSGFSNQLSEFKNALLISAILNRTLIVPPVLDHHAVALGSCPKFRVTEPRAMRVQVWDHAVQLVREGRYVSMADIIDLSPVSKEVRTIDLRYFVSLWCGVEMDSVCLDNSKVQSSISDKLAKCGSVLAGLSSDVDKCVYAVDADCRTTVWTYRQSDLDGAEDSFQADEQLRSKKKISYVRHRRDIFKTLGPGSEAHFSSVLSFGSLFTAPYKGSQLHIDIHGAPGDNRIQSVFTKIEFMPFVSDITKAGQEFVRNKITAPFLCAQLRLLDGQFKNHWKTTFSGLKQKVEALKEKGPLPVHIFVMTDLPRSNWSSSYLGELESDPSSFNLHFLSDEDEVVRKTAKKTAAADNGQWPRALDVSRRDSKLKEPCPHHVPDVRLYVEETVCSCASLGFVGTAGSTIAESIGLMRKNNVCSVKS